MNTMEILGFTFAALAAIYGYYYSRRYGHIDLRIMMWVGIVGLPVWVWSTAVRHHVVNLSGTQGEISDWLVRAYAFVTLVLFMKVLIDMFSKANYK